MCKLYGEKLKHSRLGQLFAPAVIPKAYGLDADGKPLSKGVTAEQAESGEESSEDESSAGDETDDNTDYEEVDPRTLRLTRCVKERYPVVSSRQGLMCDLWERQREDREKAKELRRRQKCVHRVASGLTTA